MEESSSAATIPGMESSIAAMEDQATANVTYAGVITPLLGTNTREGTHLLDIGGGATILLKSDTVLLDHYINKSVHVTGSVRPTTDGTAKILNVSSVEIVMTGNESGTMVPSSAMMQTTSVAAPVASSPAVTANSSAAPKASKAAASTAAVTPPPSTTVQAETTAMAKEHVDSTRWTQQYCSSFMGFCIPVHKNWYFHQFPTDAYVWHVELSSHELLQMGDGPIVVNLVNDATAGTMESKGATEGSVQEEGDFAVGYRAWKNGKHFEITAPKSLMESVRFITTGLTPYGQ